MTQSLISIFINTYNHAKYIEQAINSVIEQEFPATEMDVLVIDDGSTDDTFAIVQKFARESSPRVRCIRKENGGQISTYNAALPELRGQIVAFLDGDDWWAKGKLSAVAGAFEANPDIAAVGHGYYEVFDTKPPHEMLVPAKTFLLRSPEVEDVHFIHEAVFLLGTSRLAVRRRVLDRVGPLPREAVFFDTPVFNLALALGGALILDRPLCYYRRHAENLWSPARMNEAARRRYFERIGFLLDYIAKRLAEVGVSQNAIDALNKVSRIEYDRLKSQFSENTARWSTALAEWRRFRAYYQRPSFGYLLFECAVCAAALALPPRSFDRVREWYSQNDLRRFREFLGKPKPKIAPAFFQRRPVPSEFSR
ncbi:MAG: glycosyltransferase [Candidatus Acidiferrales bacterium]